MEQDIRIVVLTTAKIIEFINNEEFQTKDFEIWIESQLLSSISYDREILRSIANSCNAYHSNKRHELLKLNRHNQDTETSDYFNCEYHIAISKILRDTAMFSYKLFVISNFDGI